VNENTDLSQNLNSIENANDKNINLNINNIHKNNLNNYIILTPEDSVQTQINIGTDIIMQLDDVIPASEVAKDNFKDRVQLAADRSIRWLDRSIEYINKLQGDTVTSNIFPIVQGGVDLTLRKQMCEQIKLRHVPGVAIGGLVGGESKFDFIKVVSVCCDTLPTHIPR